MIKRPRLTTKLIVLLVLFMFGLPSLFLDTGPSSGLKSLAAQLTPPSPERKQRFLEDTLTQRWIGEGVTTTDIEIVGDWARIGLLEKETQAVAEIASHSTVIIGRWEGSEWRLYVEGTPEFRVLLSQVPETLISTSQKVLLDYENPPMEVDIASVTASGYRLPWKAGDNRLITRAWTTGSCNHAGSNAVDVSMALGTDILAMRAGTVITVVEGNTNCGCSSSLNANYIEIDHGDGTIAQYVHIGTNQALVSVDQAISQGQLIAKSHQIGNTCGQGTCAGGTCSLTPSSCTPGAHLHFAVIRDNVRQYITFDDVSGGNIAGCQSYTSGNTGTAACCGCSSAIATTNASPLGGEAIGPPSPQADPAVTFDLTSPGDQSAAPSLIEGAVAADTTPPNLTALPSEANWTSTITQPSFTWPDATDEGVGLAGYRVYWGPDENGTAETLVTEPAFATTPPDTSDGAAVYYLRVAPLDKAGNLGEWRTVGIWRYDALPPTGVVQVSGGEIVPMLPVTLNLAATDEHSGVDDMRFSNDGTNWSEWEPYAVLRGWQLADVDEPQTIYAQFRDRSGNESAIVSTSTTADLTTALPASANYRITRSVMGTGGGAKASTSYRLSGTSGQPFQTGAMQSNGYRLASGYWAQAGTPPNNPPNAPATPNPAHNATSVGVTASLAWTGSDPDNDPLTYEVRFGTTNPPPQVVAGQSATTYDPPGSLANSTTYHWQIIADDGRGGVTPGPIWSFTTAAPPNQPPNAPANPDPTNAATNVAITAGLSWSATDPDNDPLTYEVHFGTTNPPPQVVASQSATTYDLPGDLASSTPYYWQIVADDGRGGVTPGPVWSFTTAPAAPAFPDIFFVSPATSGTISGIAYTGSDILKYTKSTNTWAMFFDGSDVGVTKNVSAFAFLPGGDNILLSFAANQALGGLGTFTAQDVVRFDPSQTGNTTAGTFAWYFDGSDVGLTTTGEKIDALDALDDGRLLLSTTGAAAVPGLAKQQDEDVLAFTLTAAGQTTSGTWAAYFNGTAVTGLGAEDVSGFWLDEATGDRYLTIVGAFNLGGVKGNGKSIVKLPAGSTTPSLVTWTTPPFNVDGLELVR